MSKAQVRVIISTAMICVSLLISGGGAFVALSNDNITLCIVVVLFGVLSMIGFTVMLLSSLPNSRGSIDLKGKNQRGVDYYKDIKRLCDEVQDKRSFFNIYKDDDSIMEIYNLLSTRAEQNVSKAERFVSAYNFSVSDGTDYLNRLHADTLQIVKKLNELIELSIHIEDSTSDVDISSAVDMLDSLKEVFKEDI